MRGPAGIIRQFCLMAAACILLGIGGAAMREAGFWRKTISLACVEQEITGEQIAEIRRMEAEKENRTAFTAWREKSGGVVCQTDGSRAVGTRVIEINGSSELLVPYGKILQDDDLQGCLLGRRTAEKLFGSQDAAGLTLRYGERELTVRGVFREPEDLMVVAAGEGTDSFRRLNLKSWEPVAAGLAAERFVQNYGIDAEQVHYDFFRADYLQSLIPGKWSDFDGWRQSLMEAGEDIRFLISVEKSCLETKYLACIARACVNVLAASFLLLCSLRFPDAARSGPLPPVAAQPAPESGKKRKILHLFPKSTIIDK